jgi:acetyl-CoA carboxylase beta subunit
MTIYNADRRRKKKTIRFRCGNCGHIWLESDLDRAWMECPNCKHSVQGFEIKLYEDILKEQRELLDFLQENKLTLQDLRDFRNSKLLTIGPST